jgi:ABC-type transport system involved in cytochrome c biogenesis permease subunit
MSSLPSLIKLLLLTSAGLNLVSWGLYLATRRRAALLIFAAAWGFNLAVFFINWSLAGQPPFGNMYHVHIFLGLCFLPLFGVLALRDKLTWAGAYFTLPAAIILIGAFSMDPQIHWKRMPALQSPWFVPHVFAYMVSYALATVAFVMTVAKWIRRRDAALVARYSHAARQVIRLGLPFMTFGLLSGALWAEEAWGRYWSWDTKETWSLITWIGYIAYLHCRYDPRTARWADALQTAAFVALLWTFFLVNLMPKLASAMHSYAS